MTKNKYLTNQQLLKELEKKLPEFTQDEFITLTGLLVKYRQEFMKTIQLINPQVHHWVQQKLSEHEQEKTDKDTEQLKKSLDQNNMPKSKKLENKISPKLDQLQELIDKLDEVRLINSDDPETWDADVLYNLIENLKETLQLLEDKKHPKEKDPWGEPLILEAGLCSLMDEYHEDEEDSEDF